MKTRDGLLLGQNSNRVFLTSLLALQPRGPVLHEDERRTVLALHQHRESVAVARDGVAGCLLAYGHVKPEERMRLADLQA